MNGTLCDVLWDGTIADGCERTKRSKQLSERTSRLHYWLEAEEPCCAEARVEKSRLETIAQRHICSADGATRRVREALRESELS
jgi:hypothetical protein